MKAGHSVVLYLRSSKDRKDVSISAQRRELEKFAAAKGWLLRGEYVDNVISGKNAEDRPAFMRMLGDLKSQDRTWSVILVLDTSRIARNQFVAHFLTHECKKRSVDLVFSKTPELDGVAKIILPANLHAMDEVHSYMSREKGLAGMRENVLSGYRAGGRAPFGYSFSRIERGVDREGQPVTKSKLIPNTDAPIVRGFLKDRAARVARHEAAARHGLKRPAATLIGIERNALTYCGHSTWNRHYGDDHEGSKYRPREEWVICRDTHAALITENEAEAVLEQVMAGTRARSHPKKLQYLLSGLLTTPSGMSWHGTDGDFYRFAKKRRISASEIERAVVAAVFEDLRTGSLAKAIYQEILRHSKKTEAGEDLAGARRKVADIDRKLTNLWKFAADGELVDSARREILKLEDERRDANRLVERLVREANVAREVRSITEATVQLALQQITGDLEKERGVEGLREQLQGLLQSIEVDPEHPVEAVVRYRMDPTGVELASPRGFEPRLPP